ncbi:MAG: hypothetical protein D6778_06315 [Nitrospirae bacterium]|nr:MAG: hypothetical protein D6778_06315 [Nitrospirota bacterium]
MKKTKQPTKKKQQPSVEPFEFRASIRIVRFTGYRARDLKQLLDGIKNVSEDSIYHHTIEYFLKGHPIYFTNDFAQWVGDALEESALAEKLSNIDPYRYKRIDEIRKSFLNAIKDYLDEFPEPRPARAGEEFSFNESFSVVYPVGLKVQNLAEMLFALKVVEDRSIFYHFYEARRRLDGVDDFSMWIEYSLKKKELADQLRAIDPFMHDLEGIRQRIIETIERYLWKEMKGPVC